MGMKKLMVAGLFLVMLVGGCDEAGDKAEIEVGKPFAPASDDVVNRHGKIENLDQFEAFFENVQNDKKAHIRIVSYTIEGDPILHDLEYDGDVIHSFEDSRRDAYGSGETVKMKCRKIEFTPSDRQSEYNLKECNKKEYNKTVLWYE
ncbi:hypothetical protein BHE18_12210 [Rossellomorea aquimaris]|uniref:DUF4362 domain-containing protein n=2 Tax=Rossellomorea aquimaris TaxID=189382 RepID=A0A1J6VYT2_9BACI|nr:hypothetical protein BHE18_12210 [Rossellomorea aquimaris]